MVVHIVRRYGLVGGMEGYVWELTHALTALGAKVEVICEQLCGTPSANIKVHTVTQDNSSSRWRAMLGFRARVNSLISEQFADRKIIIHSHERTLNHQITTIHGPPIQTKTDWWRFFWLNPRIKAWKKMERDELLGPQVQFVLPVSNIIKTHLLALYPNLKAKSIAVAYPGVEPPPQKQTSFSDRNGLSPLFVFVGKEWKRKGLRFAIEVIENYASRFEKCVLEIYGPAKSKLPNDIRHHPNVVAKEWVNEIPWGKYDALIHPATNEPFGMVVPEARSHGIPVLTTNLVGSTELNFKGVTVLDSNEPIEIWVENLQKDIRDKKNRAPEIKWTWQDLASKHIDDIYPKLTIK